MKKEEDAFLLIILGAIIVIIAGATYPTEFEQFFGADPTWNILGIIAGVVFIVWGISKYTESKKELVNPQQLSSENSPLSIPHKTTSQIKTLESEQKDSLPQCPNCNAEIQAGWKACPSCGNKL